VRKMVRKMKDAIRRMAGEGATLNAMHEIDRAASSVVDLDVQLRRVSSLRRPAA